jgi:tetrahydromethanopterin S-methyltransferase subunit B
MHSIRFFCYTQCKLVTGDADYAHGYIGHDRYLAVYERLEEKEQVELFNRCTSRLSIFEDAVILSHDDANEKINKLENQVAKLIQTLEILSENPDTIRVRIMKNQSKFLLRGIYFLNFLFAKSIGISFEENY